MVPNHLELYNMNRQSTPSLLTRILCRRVQGRISGSEPTSIDGQTAMLYSMTDQDTQPQSQGPDNPMNIAGPVRLEIGDLVDAYVTRRQRKTDDKGKAHLIRWVDVLYEPRRE
jgi:hypothetical protein